MLNLEAVGKKYKGIKAIENISFSIGESEIIGLIGENGAGKTTLLKCISKAISLTEGDIFYMNQNIHSHSNSLIDVGFLIESTFYDHLSAYENIVFFLRIHQRSDYIPYINDYLNLVELYKRKNDKVSTFSFGMKQRLSLVMCLILKPRLLIMDEPFIGLDYFGKKEIYRLIAEMVNKDNISVLISSHQIEEISEICTRYIYLDKGEIIFDGKGTPVDKKIFTLDRPYSGKYDSFIDETNVRNLIIEYTGEELDNFIREVQKNYTIIDITKVGSKVSNYFFDKKNSIGKEL